MKTRIHHCPTPFVPACLALLLSAGWLLSANAQNETPITQDLIYVDVDADVAEVSAESEVSVHVEVSEEAVSRTWLGVSLAPVADSVREYLDLPLGFGVSVEHVMDESPAAKAGLESKDILMQLDDQHLTTPEHLQVLVATYDAGDSVELVVLRKGKEQVIKVTLGEAELPPLSHIGKQEDDGDNVTIAPMTTLVPANPVTVQVVPEVATDGAGLRYTPALDHEEIQKRIADYRTKMQEWMKQPPATRGKAPTLDLGRPDVRAFRVRPAKPDGDAAAGDGDAAGAEAHATSSGAEVRITGGPSITIGPGASIVASGSSGGVVKINNAKGSVTIKSKDGESIIEVTDADGKVVHTGPYEKSDDMLDRLPKEAQAVLKEMNLNNLEMLNIQVGSRTATSSSGAAAAAGASSGGKDQAAPAGKAEEEKDKAADEKDGKGKAKPKAKGRGKAKPDGE